MSEAHDAFSPIIHIKSGGIIHGGHFVVMSSSTVVEASGAQTSFGVLAQTEDCASGDIVPICVLGPVKAWCDGSSAIAIGAYIACDTSGHGVVDTTASHHIQGMALEALASGLAFLEILVVPSQG